MLMYGNSLNADLVDAKIYNISGMKEGFEKLQILIPPNEVGTTYGREFDIAYMNYIMIVMLFRCHFINIELIKRMTQNFYHN